MLGLLFLSGLAAPKSIDALAEELLTVGQNQGVWVGFSRAGQKSVGCAGISDSKKQERANPNQILSFASISKPITATVMTEILLRQGKGLDTPVVEVNPKWKSLALPDYAAITLEDLLLHRHNLPRDFRKRVVTKEGFQKVREEQSLDLLQQPPRENKERKSLYSNAGYSLFTSATEQLTKSSFEENCAMILNDKMKLPSLTFLTDKIDAKLRPQTYNYNRSWTPVPSDSIRQYDWQPSGGLKGTLADLLGFGDQYCEATYRDVPGLQQATVKVLAKEAVGRSLAWATGTFGRSHRYYTHSGKISGERSVMFIFPERKWTLAWYRNSTAAGTDEEDPEKVNEVSNRLWEYAFAVAGVRTSSPCDVRITKTEFVDVQSKASVWPSTSDPNLLVHVVLQVSGATVNDFLLRTKLGDETRHTFWLDGLKPGTHHFYHQFKMPRESKFPIEIDLDSINLINDVNRLDNVKRVEIDLKSRTPTI